MPDPRRVLPLPEYVFDARLGATGRYVSRATGRIVARDGINAAMEARIDAGKAVVDKLSVSLAKGEISLAQWQIGMRDEVKLLHTMAGATSKGGWDRMAPADWGRIGNITKSQYQKLQAFAIDIADGKEKLTNLKGEVNGRFLQRSKMYANAAYGTMEEANRLGAGDRGMVEERRVREAENSCDDCIRYAAMGWQLIGTLPPIGVDSACLTNCRCSFQWRNAAGEVFE